MNMMNNENMVKLEQIILKAVQTAVEDEVKKIVEQAKERLDRRIPEIVAGVSLRVMKGVSMETLHNTLMIKIKMDDLG